MDTNHFNEFAHASAVGTGFKSRLESQPCEVFYCIIGAEESLRGWLALIRHRKNGVPQLDPYARLLRTIETLNLFTILPFDREAAEVFHRLKQQHPQGGTMDLKIAAICLAHDATLLTRNLRDFEGIDGLRVENWLD